MMGKKTGKLIEEIYLTSNITFKQKRCKLKEKFVS